MDVLTLLSVPVFGASAMMFWQASRRFKDAEGLMSQARTVLDLNDELGDKIIAHEARHETLMGQLKLIGAELSERLENISDLEHENAELKRLFDTGEDEADNYAARAHHAEYLVARLLDVAPVGLDPVLLSKARTIAESIKVAPRPKLVSSQ